MLGHTTLTHPSPQLNAPTGTQRTKKVATEQVPPASDRQAKRGQEIVERPQVVEEPASGLIRFVLMLAIVCGITCVYVWQVSIVADIKNKTAALKEELDDLEQDNAELILELTPFQDPAYVEGQADKLGLASGRPLIHVDLQPMQVVANQPIVPTAYNAGLGSGPFFSATVQRLFALLSDLTRQADQWGILMKRQPGPSETVRKP
jgi:hypothetical protein